MKKILFCLIIALCCLQARAADQDTINREIYGKVAAAVSSRTDLPTSDLTVQIALSLLGTPYVGGTLEGEAEELRIFLDKTDCILFVEACVCMALTFKGLEIVQGSTPKPAEPSYELFCANIRNMRYRDGVVNGYASRLHYTSEWILQAEKNGILKEYTSDAGSPREQHFSFMTSHSDLYPKLKDDPVQTGLVREAEQRLDASGPYYWVPQSQISGSRVHCGDIIFIVSATAGLDITHVAIAYEQDGAMHFIHASTKANKVIIEPRTLADYATRGIRLAHLL